MQDTKRFYELDLMRFTAAIMVVIYHYCFRGYAADDMSVLAFQPIDQIAKYGYLGVELFFMISGFVILYSAQHFSAVKFTISRLARLYPTFWICMLITALVTVLIGGERYSVTLTQVLVNLTMIPTELGQKYVDGVYWTLLVEIKFYFLVFCLLVLKQMPYLKFYLAAWLAVAIGHQFWPLHNFAEFFLIPYNAAYFIAGACFYLWFRDGLSPLIAITILVSLLLNLFIDINGSARLASHYSDTFNPWVIGTMICLFYVIFYMMTTNKLSFLDYKYLYHLGALTYPIYLLHQNIGFMIFNLIGDSISKWITLVAVILLMAWLSWMVHIHIEKRFGPKMKNGLTTLALKLNLLKAKH